jgi:4-hydroxy-3-methylbut-2-enyl diphosphate reductase
MRLLVCAPMGIEARALRAGLPAAPVRRTGLGPRRSARSAGELTGFGALAVAGLAGGLDPALSSGRIVVASELRGHRGTISCPYAPVLVADLIQQGLPVTCGPVVTTDHVVRGQERTALARTGALAVDMESAELAAAAGDRPLIVARVLLDTPNDPLPTALRRLAPALRRLRQLSPSLDRWSQSVPRNEEHARTAAPGEDHPWASQFDRPPGSGPT